jgi:hypothetical protein
MYRERLILQTTMPSLVNSYRLVKAIIIPKKKQVSNHESPVFIGLEILWWDETEELPNE